VKRQVNQDAVQPEQEGAMSPMSARKKYSLIPGWILTLAIVALGVIQSGNPAHLVDSPGFLFVLLGGIALVMISFPGAEIRRALRDAAGAPANEVDIRASAFFWEAAGRGFWIVGVLRSILHLLIFFRSIGTVEYGTWQLIIKELSQSLVTALYGLVLAVICFIPCWMLTGKLRSLPLTPTGAQGPISDGHTGLRFGIVSGYVLFFSFLAPWFPRLVWPGFKPAFLVVVGGTIALMLIIRGANSGPTLSTALAAMGIIGFLIGAIQLQGHVAGAFAFLLSSGLTSLLGMVLVGGPLEDRAIRTGRVATPSAFSRVAWYVFPLQALIFLVPICFVLIIPGLG
jgi:flagellar motor component MotA